MAAGQPLGVQVTGTSGFFRAAITSRSGLESAILQAITDAGFTVSQFTVSVPGLIGQILTNSYDFTIRVVVDAWTDQPFDTVSAIETAVAGVATVTSVSTFDVRTGQDTSPQAPSSNPLAAIGASVSSAASALNTDVKWIIVGVVVIAIAIAMTKPKILL